MPDRVVHSSPDGDPLFDHVPRELDGGPWADRLRLLRPDAVDAVLALRGWVVTCDRELAAVLVSRGARPRKYGDRMSWDLVADPPPARWAHLEPPPGLALTACDRPAADLVDAWVAAYPPGHPDHIAEPADVVLHKWIEPLLTGAAHGPTLALSALAVDSAGEVVAGVLGHHIAGDPPWGGPWITGLFRRPGPRHAGVGALLLRRAVARAAAAGLPALGLVVSAGNPAVALYERLGFRVLDHFGTVAIP